MLRDQSGAAGNSSILAVVAWQGMPLPDHYMQGPHHEIQAITSIEGLAYNYGNPLCSNSISLVTMMIHMEGIASHMRPPTATNNEP